MQKVIGVTELQRNFRAVFDEVAQKKVPYVLTRSSRPEAVLISYEEFLQWQALREQDVLQRFDALMARMAAQNEGVDEEEIRAEVEAAREALRG